MSSHLNSGAMTRSNSAHSPPPNLNIPIPYHVIDTIITTYEQLLRERLLFSNEALGAEYRMIFKTQAYVYRRSTLTADTSTKLRLLYERITGRPARFCRFPNDEECYRKLTILIDKNNRIMPVEPLVSTFSLWQFSLPQFLTKKKRNGLLRNISLPTLP